jgi:hypothetical protein
MLSKATTLHKEIPLQKQPPPTMMDRTGGDHGTLGTHEIDTLKTDRSGGIDIGGTPDIVGSKDKEGGSDSVSEGLDDLKIGYQSN